MVERLVTKAGAQNYVNIALNIYPHLVAAFLYDDKPAETVAELAFDMAEAFINVTEKRLQMVQSPDSSSSNEE